MRANLQTRLEMCSMFTPHRCVLIFDTDTVGQAVDVIDDWFARGWLSSGSLYYAAFVLYTANPDAYRDRVNSKYPPREDKFANGIS